MTTSTTFTSRCPKFVCSASRSACDTALRAVAMAVVGMAVLFAPAAIAQSTSVARRGGLIDRRVIAQPRVPARVLTTQPGVAISTGAIATGAATRLPIGTTATVTPPPPQSGASTGVRGIAQEAKVRVTVTANQLQRVTPLTSAVAEPGKTAYKFPIVFTMTGTDGLIAPTGTAHPSGTPTAVPSPTAATVAFEPRIEVDSFGLAWQTQTRKFAGVVQLYIVDTLHPTAPPSALPTPITFHVSGDGASVDPESPQIATTNVFSKINVSTARMDSLVHLHVTPYGLTTPIEITVRLAQAPLIIALGDTMPGLGFGRRDAMISFPAGFSAAADSIDVALTARNGSVSPEHVWVSPVRPGHVIFRSSGLGSGMLSAAAVGFAPSNSSIPYAWPIGFVLAALVGVVAGTLAVIMFRKESKDALPKVQVFVGGLVTGFVAAIAGSLLGVKIIDFEPGAGNGLIAVFLFSFIGAWAGPKLLSIIVPGAAAGDAAKAA